MKLRATKRSLYKLVSQYTTLPIMKNTKFHKLRGLRIYALMWVTNGVSYTAILDIYLSNGLLEVRATEYNDETGRNEVTYYQAYTFAIYKLRALGMIEEQQNAV